MNPAGKANRGQRGTAQPDSAEPSERIRAGLIELIGERGYDQLELVDLLAHLGIDQATFEDSYPSLDACFADLWERFTQEFITRAWAAFTAQESWREGMRAQGWAFYRFLSEDHLRARVCMVEVNYGGELVQATRDRFMDAYIDLVHLGRHEAGREQVPRARAEAVVGAVWERTATAVKAEDYEGLLQVTPQMFYVLFQPYLGEEAAEEELRRGPADIARFRRGEI